MKETRIKHIRKMRRTKRVRRKLSNAPTRLRLSIFRSNAHIYAQIIDDVKGITIVSVSEKELKDMATNKSERAAQLGGLLAKKAEAKKIKEVAFDKGPYRYHGRVKQFADGARVGGLKF